MSERTQRRLAAIVSADVVGYSRLMGIDEEGTLAALRAHRAELIDTKIAEHGGRIVKTMGDGLLLEFPSVVNATKCVIEIQRGMAERNEGIDEDRLIAFRVGVNLGDIIIDGEDIHGDGVNIAARLQEISEPGGVSISRRVHEDVQDRLDTPFEDAGEKTLKNIARPIHVWQWPANTSAASPVASGDERIALALPDKPSIAILPFANMSGDPEQAYFADGLSEDIITGLSCIRSLFVIARNSSFVYRGASVDVNRVSQELGVRYVLEGSVRRSGNRIRVTGQLIDTPGRNHIWARKFDRDLEDIFDVQDEITNAIVAAIGAEVDSAERARALRRPTNQLDAWSFYQRAMWHVYQHTNEDFSKAISFFEEALSRDANLALAQSGLSYAHYFNALLDSSDEFETKARKALHHAKRAVSLDDKDPISYWNLGRAYRILGEVEQSIPSLRTALELNPNYAQAHYNLGWSLVLAGRTDAETIGHLDQALRLSPRDPLLHTFLIVRAISAMLLGDLLEALRWAESAVQQSNTHFQVRAGYIVILEMNGKHAAAVKEARELLAERPEYRSSFFRRVMPYQRREDIDPQISCLVAAGIPE